MGRTNNDLCSVLREKHCLWGTWGLLSCLFEKALKKTIRLYFHRYTIYEYNIIGKLDVKVDEKYRVAELSYEDFVKQSDLNPQWFIKWKLGMIRRALLKRGNTAIGLFDGDLLVAYRLIDFSTFVYTGCKLGTDDAYLWDCYVHPKYRGQGLHFTLTKLCINKCSELGKKRTLLYTDSYNKASHHAKQKAGFIVLQKCLYIRWWKFKYHSIKYPL